ncbi:DNA (cytosine-5-)-methyltransferase [Flavobacteriaceae bacterium]|jgi:DNA (cytosine-5)-methyltransferase 1|nr:DNA (cytosine-5-)-methyltransferase [Flavobacteriaceae bacterium]
MKIKVVELFAGVGGFRLGLEGWNGKSSSSQYNKPLNSNFEVVWSNQWEPSTKTQHANIVYKSRWPKANHCGENIEDVVDNKFKIIPPHDLLVGGFPCQDYSVATSLKNSKGLVGTKGVLWWSIYNIISNKKSKKPKYLFLENVDRLLSSPAIQRGRDFAVMLSCLYEQGYAVEWKIINAADYSMPQRRRRVYIVAYHKSSDLYTKMRALSNTDLITNSGVISSAFNVSVAQPEKKSEGKLSKKFNEVSANFNKGGGLSPFYNSGVMFDGKYFSAKTQPIKTKKFPLKKVLDTNEVDKSFYIDREKKVKHQSIEQIDGTTIEINTEWDKWKYLKGRKNQWKINKSSGYKYKYGEGKMIFPDSVDEPSRTIITGEGGATPSRFKHVIEESKGIYRRLTPIELEQLNMFPKNHTFHKEVSDVKRAFFMGNALVVGVIEKIGAELHKNISHG